MTDRLAAVAHYVIARHAGPAMGATKLNKVLWFADCEFFRRHGVTITGETAYVRKPNGPCSPRLEGVLKDLNASGLIHEEPVMTMIGKPRRQMYSTGNPDVSMFSGEEVDVLNEVAKEIAALSAQEASDLSHDDLWREADPNTLLPVAAGAVRSAGLSPEDAAWAREAFA